MISPVQFPMQGMEFQSCPPDAFVFNFSLFSFHPLELKKSPRSPRAGSSGRYFALSSKETVKAGNKFEENEIPQTSPKFRDALAKE